MSGASNAHNLIIADIFAELHGQLKGRRCLVYTGDMRVKTGSTTSYFYSDITVVCDKPRVEDHTLDTLLNPIVGVEGLSPSTEASDRGEKFAHYQQLVSLQEYILVSQDKIRVEYYLRQGTHWLLSEFGQLDDVMSLLQKK